MTKFLRNLLIAALLASVPAIAQAQIATPANSFYLPGSQNNTATTLGSQMIFPCDIDTSGGGGAPGSTSTTGYCNIPQIGTFVASQALTLTNKTINFSLNTPSNFPVTALSTLGAVFSTAGGTMTIATGGITASMLANQGSFTAGQFANATVTVNQQGLITNIAAGSGGGGGGNISGGTMTSNATVIGSGGTNIAVLASLGTSGWTLHSQGASSPPIYAVTNFSSDPLSGVVPVANLGTGTPSAATVLLGSGAWGSVSGTQFATVGNNTFFAGQCTGSPNINPTFRALCIQDLPALPYNAQGTPSSSYTVAAVDLGGVVDALTTSTGTFTANAAVVTQGNYVVFNNESSGNWTAAGTAATANGLNSTTMVPGTSLTFVGNNAAGLDAFGMQTATSSRLGGFFSITCMTGQFVTALNTNGTITCNTGSGSGNVLTSGTINTNGFPYWNGSTTMASTAAATNGQILIGSTGAAPVAALPTGTNGVTVTGGAGTLTIGGSTLMTSTGSTTNNAIIVGAGGQASSASAITIVGNALTVSAAGTSGTIIMGNTSTGTVTLRTVTGTLGSTIAQFPGTGTTDTVALIGNANAFTGNNSYSGTTTWTGTLFVPFRDITASGAVTVSATTDYFICVRKTTGAATTVNLPASPAAGQTYLIKDCKGDAATNNITITPNSGNIDGSSTLVLNTAYQSAAVTYDATATTWFSN